MYKMHELCRYNWREYNLEGIIPPRYKEARQVAHFRIAAVLIAPFLSDDILQRSIYYGRQTKVCVVDTAASGPSALSPSQLQRKCRSSFQLGDGGARITIYAHALASVRNCLLFCHIQKTKFMQGGFLKNELIMLTFSFSFCSRSVYMVCFYCEPFKGNGPV